MRFQNHNAQQTHTDQRCCGALLSVSQRARRRHYWSSQVCTQTNKQTPRVFLISFSSFSSSSFVAICFLLLFLVSFLMPMFDLQFSALQASDLLCLIYNILHLHLCRLDFFLCFDLESSALQASLFLCLTYNILHL